MVSLLWLLPVILAPLVVAEKEDVYGTACMYSAVAYNFGCESVDDDDVYSMAPCLCNTTAFLETVVGCIETNSPDEEWKELAYESVGGICMPTMYTYNLTQLVAAVPSLPSDLSDAQLNSLHTTGFIMPAPYLEHGFRVVEIANASGPKSDYYAAGLLAYWAFVLLLRIVTNFFYQVTPRVLRTLDTPLVRKFRKHVLLPPAGRYHHSTPHSFFGFTFNIPLRAHTLAIAIFVILNLAFTFADYTIIVPNFYYDNSRIYQYANYCGTRTGMIGMAEFLLIILFAGRNNILIWVTGWPMDTFNVFHKWVARVLLFEIVVHAVFESVSFGVGGYYIEAWTEFTYWKWGVVAMMMWLALNLQALHYFRAKSYEIFLYLHIVLAAVSVPATWYHVNVMGPGIMPYLYATVAVWGFDRVARIARIAFSGVLSKGDMTVESGSVIQMKLTYSQRWKFYPGCYVFVYILGKNKFWQSHPFTVVTSPRPEDNGKLVLFAKIKDGITKHTWDHLMKQPCQSAQLPVLIEGPYGSHHAVHHYDTLVLICGGIGVTGVYPYAAELRDKPDRKQRIIFIWAMSNDTPLQWFRDQLDYLSSDPRIEMNIHVSNIDSSASSVNEVESEGEKELGFGEREKQIKEDALKASCKDGRPDVKQLVVREMTAATGTVAFMTCGPDAMNDDVRTAVAENLESAKARVDYFEEAFSW